MKRIIPLLCLIMILAMACRSGPKLMMKNEVKQEEVKTKPTSKFFEPALVSDNAQIFSEREKANLEKIIAHYENETTNEIAIVSVDSIKPYEDLQAYSLALFKDWKIGKKGKDNGLLIVINKSSREVRIMTGYGTEKILTDEICKLAIDNYIIPNFKHQKYYEGIKDAMIVLIEKWSKN